MKLLVDCTPLSTGGGVQVAIALLDGLSRRADVNWTAVLPHSLRPSLPPAVAAHAGRLTFLQKETFKDMLQARLRLRRIEGEVVPDVVFTVFGPAYFRARAPHVVGFALPLLIYEPTGLVAARTVSTALGDRLRCHLFRQADHLVVETETVRQRVARIIGYDQNRITVIGNSVNPLLLRYERTQAPADGRYVVIVPSAAYPHKNLDILPSVAAALASLDPTLDFEIRLTLDPADALWASIAATAQRLGVGDRIRTLGVLNLDELARSYLAASAVLLPTLREASTAVYPESFYFRRPLVTSNMDFAREACDDAALYAPPHDAAAFASQLRALSGDPGLVERQVRRGEQRLASQYPSASAKFEKQIALLAAMGEGHPCRSSVRASKGASPGVEANAVEAAAQAVRTGTKNMSAIQYHDALAQGWDERYARGSFLRRSSFFAREVLAKVEIDGSSLWLDAGCGSGYFTRMLAAAGCRVIGVDGSRQMIAQAIEKGQQGQLAGKVEFRLVETVEWLPLSDQMFEGCLCLSVIEYLDDPGKALDELARVLKPGGLLILSVPHPRSSVRLAQRLVRSVPFFRSLSSTYLSHSKFTMTRRDMRNALGARGFEIVSLASFGPLLPGSFSGFAPTLQFVTARMVAKKVAAKM